MRLVVIAVAVVLAGAALPATHAHARGDGLAAHGSSSICAEPSQLVSYASMFAEPASPSLGDAAPLALAPDAIGHEERDDNDTPWCVTADDPRCSPRDSGTLPMQVAAQPKLLASVGLVIPSARTRAVSQPLARTLSGALRDAQAGRLERPPRA